MLWVSIFWLIHPGRLIISWIEHFPSCSLHRTANILIDSPWSSRPISKTSPSAVLSSVRIALWPPINCLLVQRLPRLPQVIKIAEKVDIAKSKIHKISIQTTKAGNLNALEWRCDFLETKDNLKSMYKTCDLWKKSNCDELHPMEVCKNMWLYKSSSTS